MENIRIQVLRENYIIVTADTDRFGKGDVMFEGNTFDQCFDYIKREIGLDSLPLASYLSEALYTDRMGRCFPCDMEVLP